MPLPLSIAVLPPLDRASRWLLLPLVLGASGCGDTIIQQYLDPDASVDGGQAGDPTGNDAGSGLPATCEKDSDCDDADACNGSERCNEGTCERSKPIDCDDGLACTTDGCDPLDGTCSHDAPDRDGDGEQDANCKDAEGRSIGNDCDDDDPERFPGNTEVCTLDAPTHDEDCNPETFGTLDADQDGFSDARCANEDAEGTVYAGRDCDDSDPSTNPTTAEVCDGFDNNCNGEVDEGVTVALFRDADGDGVGVPVDISMVPPGTVIDGQGRIMDCAQKTAGLTKEDIDCDDQNPLRHDKMPELCDGIDNDCDGEVDENVSAVVWYRDFDGDGYGNVLSGTVSSCEPVPGYALYAGDCNDQDPLVNPNQEERCDAIDNDCNPLTTYLITASNGEDDDRDGSPDPACGLSISDCDDRDPNTYPAAPELCDGKDNDCNGIGDTRTQTVLWYLDNDGDGYGDPLVEPVASCDNVPNRATRAGDCNDGDRDVNPGAPDDCSGERGKDDDCDGQIDEDEGLAAFYYDADRDGYARLGATPLFACVAPDNWVKLLGDCNDLVPGISPGVNEDCDPNGRVDEDCDGFIDCADPDCAVAPECEGLPLVRLHTPTSQPLSGLVATPIDVTLRLATPNGVGLEAHTLLVDCVGGAAALPAVEDADNELLADGTVRLTTLIDGLADLQLYPGLAVGDYECTVTPDEGVPLTVRMEAGAPEPGTVQTVVNLQGAVDDLQNNEGRAALLKPFQDAMFVEVGADGTAYVFDQHGSNGSQNGEILAVSPRGEVRRVLADFALSNVFVGAEYSMALDREGERLFVGTNYDVVHEVDLVAGTVRIFAGGGAGFVDGAPATQVAIGIPHGLHWDPDLGLVIADSAKQVYVVDHDERIRRYFDSSPSCGSPHTAQLSSCSAHRCAVATTEVGGLLLGAYFSARGEGSGCTSADYLARVLDGSTLLPLTTTGTAGSGLPLGQTTVGQTRDLILSATGRAYQLEASRLRRVERYSLRAYDVLGNGVAGDGGDHGPSEDASITDAYSVAEAPDGSLWVVDHGAHRIRRIWRPEYEDGASELLLSVEGGDGQSVYPGQASEALSLRVRDGEGTPMRAVPVWFEGTGDAPLSGWGPVLSNANGLLETTVPRQLTPGDFVYEAVAHDLHGAETDRVGIEIGVKEPDDGLLTSIVNVEAEYYPSSYTADSDDALASTLHYTTSVAADPDGVVYVSPFGYTVYAIHPDNRLVRVAGGGSNPPNHVPGRSAILSNASRVFSLRVHHPSRRMFLGAGAGLLALDIDSGIIWTVAGGGTGGVEGGPATDHDLGYVYATAVSEDGTQVYFTQTGRLLRVDLASDPPTLHTVRTLEADNSCDAIDVPYCNSGANSLAERCGLAMGPDGRLYVAGSLCIGTGAGQHARWLFTIDPEDGEVTRIAPLGAMATRNMDFDQEGRLYFADSDGHQVGRWVDDGTTTGHFEHVAGTGVAGFNGSGLPATETMLNTPYEVAVLPNGDVVIADRNNYTVRRVWNP